MRNNASKKRICCCMYYATAPLDFRTVLASINCFSVDFDVQAEPF